MSELEFSVIFQFFKIEYYILFIILNNYIKGNEGMRAVLTADFAIGEF